jgi:hypothetical protein
VNPCSRCNAEALPHTGCCLACGFDADAEPRPISCRLDVVIDATTQSDALGDLLQVCAPEHADRVPLLMTLSEFEIAVEARPTELAWLEGACLALGAQPHVSDGRSPDASRKIIWNFGGWVRSKILVVVTLGGLGIYFGVPLVSAGALMMLVLLVRRIAVLVDPHIHVSGANIQALCRPVDSTLFSKLKGAREGLVNPAVVKLLDECAGAFAELSWILKSKGVIGNRSLRTVEARLRHLLERACALARVAEDAMPEPVVSSRDGGLEALSVLATVRDRLVALRPTLAEIGTEVRRRDAVEGALDAIANVDGVIDRALDGRAGPRINAMSAAL